jgi:hypothetical protein
MELPIALGFTAILLVYAIHYTSDKYLKEVKYLNAYKLRANQYLDRIHYMEVLIDSRDKAIKANYDTIVDLDKQNKILQNQIADLKVSLAESRLPEYESKAYVNPYNNPLGRNDN